MLDSYNAQEETGEFIEKALTYGLPIRDHRVTDRTRKKIRHIDRTYQLRQQWIRDSTREVTPEQSFREQTQKGPNKFELMFLKNMERQRQRVAKREGKESPLAKSRTQGIKLGPLKLRSSQSKSRYLDWTKPRPSVDSALDR